ncbi:MAG: tyrosinase family protein [Pyrinomonadaceae bacterium]
MADQPQDKQPQAASRYERVRQILDAAQGSVTPSYQGLGRFWNLPLDTFMSATLYGIRLIADPVEPDPCDDIIKPTRSCCQDEEPAPQPAPLPMTEGGGHSCCGGGDTPGGGGGGGPKPSKGRGAASGLIKGLRGEFPFDGTQFPPLMWGGQRVSASDILFIQSWIDDGCPDSDAPETLVSLAQVSLPLALARAQGHEEHPLSTKTVNDFSFETNRVKVRKNVECLNAEELERFRRVIRMMKCYDDFHQYDQRSFRFWADIHANNCQHGWEQFLTWHRMYLYYFEQQMQDIDPTVTLPYWDWPMYRDDVLASIQDMQQQTGSLDNGTLPCAYRCWVDRRMLDNLQGKIPGETWAKLERISVKELDIRCHDKTRYYDSGLRLFNGAGINYGADPAGDQLIIAELERVNPLWIWNRWPGGNAGLIFEAWPTEQDIQNILKLPSFYNFGSGPDSNHFFGACENIHNLIHNFSGGGNPNFGVLAGEPQYGYMQSAGTTARDPIFWAHHSNVDRLYSEWQGQHPGAGPDDPEDILAPWPNQVKDVEAISDLGYEYMKSAYVFETNSQLPIARFRSAAAAVHPAVLQRHSRAEIRLHKVQYSTSGGAFVRVFLNQPEADASTPTRDNPNFVAQLATFSGECIGGPGHCDVPSESRRKYDIRPRHRKTPGNFRIDATEAVRRLSEQGTTDFQVNLVVLDIDGTPKPNALWMHGVSLNFKD